MVRPQQHAETTPSFRHVYRSMHYGTGPSYVRPTVLPRTSMQEMRPSVPTTQPIYRTPILRHGMMPLRFKHSSQCRTATSPAMHPAVPQRRHPAAGPWESEPSRPTGRATNELATMGVQQRPTPMDKPAGTGPGQQASSPHVDQLRSCLAALGGPENNEAAARQFPDRQPQTKPVQSTVAKRRLCERCGRLAFFLCSGCRNVWYCSQQCQMVSWNDHSIQCT
ncbi:hypothetical protein LSAT2_012121 [Lamellibrachia satsuma]|nr:hypothetical protein LSAT2_012121 [Lamellibrachia satsuma]